MMEEVFKILGVGVSNPDLSFVKSTLMKLPNWHFAKEYSSKAGDLDTDAGLVDTFLNPLDRSYSVEDVFSFIKNADLEFVDWNDRLYYSLDALVGQDHQFKSKILGLSNIEKYKLVELLSLQLATHRFILSHQNNADRIELSSDNSHLIVPKLRHGVTLTNNYIARSYHSLAITESQYNLLAGLTTKHSLFDLSQEHDIDINDLILFVGQMADCGHVLLTQR